MPSPINEIRKSLELLYEASVETEATLRGIDLFLRALSDELHNVDPELMVRVVERIASIEPVMTKVAGHIVSRDHALALARRYAD